jgi:prepilin-type N-terminal cleavage/methylation domain-containing protein
MFDRIKTRLSSEEGFTLIELLVVIVILGILVAIAVPAYLSFRGNAQDAAGKSNVRSAIPAAEEIFSNTGSYATVTGNNLRTTAPGIGAHVMAGPNATNDGYCIQDDEATSDTANTHSFYYEGGTGGTATITQGICPTATYASVG